MSPRTVSSKFASVIRSAINISMGVPSIIIGLFVYTLIVIPFGFSAYAGAIALAIIMIPVIAATTEDMLNMVPPELREADDMQGDLGRV